MEDDIKRRMDEVRRGLQDIRDGKIVKGKSKNIKILDNEIKDEKESQVTSKPKTEKLISPEINKEEEMKKKVIEEKTVLNNRIEQSLNINTNSRKDIKKSIDYKKNNKDQLQAEQDLEKKSVSKKDRVFTLKLLKVNSEEDKKISNIKLILLLTKGTESLICLLNSKYDLNTYAGLHSTIKAIMYSLHEKILNDDQFFNFYQNYSDGSVRTYGNELYYFTFKQKEILRKVFDDKDFALIVDKEFLNKVIRIEGGNDIYTGRDIKKKYLNELNTIETLNPNIQVKSKNIQEILETDFKKIEEKHMENMRLQSNDRLLLLSASSIAGILLFLFIGAGIDYDYSKDVWTFPIHFSLSLGLAFIIWKNAEGFLNFLFCILLILAIIYIISFIGGGDSCPGVFIRGQCEPY